MNYTQQCRVCSTDMEGSGDNICAQCILKPQTLTAANIRVGKTYRGKRFTGYATYNNDRTIVWISALGTEVQYDSDTVRTGRRFPIVKIEVFLKWAKREVTKEEIDAYYGRT